MKFRSGRKLLPVARSIRVVLLLSLALPLSSTQPAAAADTFDVVIRNGRIVDGSGAPWYRGDVGIRGGKIVRIGRISPTAGKTTIDAKGLVVAPGFIDMMGQTATPFLKDPAAAFNLLSQGITTINAGEGESAAPLGEADAKKAGWQSMASYFALLEKHGMPMNVVQTVGHTQVRQIVLGDVDRKPTPAELKRMQALVREAMQAGAIGVSTALIYPPAVYATTDEIAALAKVAGEYGGRYYTHMRNEGDTLLEAIDEALEIGRKGGTPVHIFHLKAAGKQNWGKMEQALAKIKAARRSGRQVTADIYPYINNGLGIEALIHPRHFAQGNAKFRARLDDAATKKTIRREMETGAGWENWFRHTGFNWDKVVVGSMKAPQFAKLNGRTIAEIASKTKRDEWTTFFEIVKAGAFAMPETMSEANKIRAMQQPFISFCTDVGPASGANGFIASHPRAWGAFPRVLALYVRKLGAISLEDAVHKMSAVAANEIMAYDRGRISVGLAADIVIFDPQTIQDRATLSQPTRQSTGMKYVLINGGIVLADGKYTGAKPGKVLRGPGYRAPAQ
jgi:N-acyl-D-aspartate/D-glutamate deacylase